MARSEARISVDIWSDPDFLALNPGAQRMFMFLLSQKDLAHDGVIALRERRWSKSAANMSAAQVQRDLAELSVARFVVVDEDAEELLVRSFIRRDRVYRQPNVLKAAADHLEVVSSPVILAALGAELRRISSAEELKKDVADIIAQMLALIERNSPPVPPEPSRPDITPAKGSGNPSGKGSPNPSDGPSAKASRDGSGVERPAAAEPFAEAPDPTMRNAGDESDMTLIALDGGRVSAGPKGSGNPSGNPSRGAPGERGVVTVVTTDSPYPGNPDPRTPLPPPAAADARERAHIREASSRRGTRIPDDFALTAEMIAWARERGHRVDLERETEKFINYWRAKTGKDATKLDWLATWRNWIMNAAQWASSSRSTGANRHIDQLTPAERAKRNPFTGAVTASKVAGGAA